MKSLKYILFICFITLALAEIISRLLVVEKEGGEFLLGKPWRYVLPIRYDDRSVSKEDGSGASYRVYDSLLGWSHGFWQSSDSMYYSDDKGYRCSRETWLGKIPGPSHYDLICIGNSFTHGDAVPYEDTWEHMLSASTGRSVLNMGVGGYGIDQAVIRFMSADKTCDTAILGLVAGDLERSLTTVYNYYTGGVKTKPKFKFGDSGYVLMNVPCVRPGEFVRRPVTPEVENVYRGIDGYNDYLNKESKWWANSVFLRLIFSSIEQRRHKKAPVYMTEGSEFEYCIRIIDVFKRHCASKGIVPVVLMIDNINTFKDRTAKGSNTWTAMKRKLDQMGILNWEFQDLFFRKFRENESDVIHPVEKVHYSQKGNRLLADQLLMKLK
jgi:hypothetical protein